MPEHSSAAVLQFPIKQRPIIFRSYLEPAREWHVFVRAPDGTVTRVVPPFIFECSAVDCVSRLGREEGWHVEDEPLPYPIEVADAVTL